MIRISTIVRNSMAAKAAMENRVLYIKNLPFEFDEKNVESSHLYKLFPGLQHYNYTNVERPSYTRKLTFENQQLATNCYLFLQSNRVYFFNKSIQICNPKFTQKSNALSQPTNPIHPTAQKIHKESLKLYLKVTGRTSLTAAVTEKIKQYLQDKTTRVETIANQELECGTFIIDLELHFNDKETLANVQAKIYDEFKTNQMVSVFLSSESLLKSFYVDVDRRLTNRSILGELYNLQKKFPRRVQFMDSFKSIEIDTCMENVKDGNGIFVFKDEASADRIYNLRDDLRLEGRKLYVYWLGPRDQSSAKLFLDMRRGGEVKREAGSWKVDSNQVPDLSLPGLQLVKPMSPKNKPMRFYGAELSFETYEQAEYAFENQHKWSLPGKLAWSGVRSPTRPKVIKIQNTDVRVEEKVYQELTLDQSGAEFDWMQM